MVYHLLSKLIRDNHFKVPTRNGTSPSLWLIITVFLIRYFYQQKVVTSFASHISNLSQLLATLVYVYDTDLYVFKDGTMDALTVSIKTQSLLNT